MPQIKHPVRRGSVPAAAARCSRWRNTLRPKAEQTAECVRIVCLGLVQLGYALTSSSHCRDCPTPAISQEKMPTGLGSEYCGRPGGKGGKPKGPERPNKAKQRFDIFDWKAVGKLEGGSTAKKRSEKACEKRSEKWSQKYSILLLKCCNDLGGWVGV